MLEWINGKRTFFIGGLIILGSIFLLLTKFDINSVPDFIWLVLNGFGLAAIRAGITSVSKNDKKGWKSYLAAISILVLGSLRIFGVEFPPEILVGLEGLGIVGLRDAINKIS